MIQALQKKYALSRQGTKDLVKGCLACALQNISFLFPVGLLYFLVGDLMAGGVPQGKLAFYGGGLRGCPGPDLCNHLSPVQRHLFCHLHRERRAPDHLGRAAAEAPLSFFWQKDLADLTSTIMADCTFLETAFSHFIPELAGSILSTLLVAVSLFFFDWRMALAALWVLPVSLAIVACSSQVQSRLNQRQMDAKMACADGIQECIETIRDLKANNAEAGYLEGLNQKIKAVEKRAILTELGTALFVVSASMLLKLGIATVALVGSVLLIGGSLDVLTFFLFLLVASRLYDPFQGPCKPGRHPLSQNQHRPDE